MSSGNIEAVLFDVDGTLTFSGTELWHEATNFVLKAYGKYITMEKFKELNFGTDLPKMLTVLGVNVDQAENIDQWCNARYNYLLEERAEWLTGGERLVEEVKNAGRRVNIVTHLRRVNMIAQEARLQWQRLFDPALIVTKDDMEVGGQKRHKPDPFGVQLAAERIGIPLDRCCYLGDMKNDMQAARNADIPGILIESNLTQPDSKSLATRVYSSRAECRVRMHEWLT